MTVRKRNKIGLIIACILAVVESHASAADWAQYKGDPARSGVSEEALAVPLQPAWIYQPPQVPRPAWEEPGKEANRLHFDHSPQPVIAGGRVFFGSSSDDTVRALDLNTGKVLWRFTTGGPIRFAPAVAGDRVYVGSDDGCVYCLAAGTGEAVWRFHAAPGDDLLLGNGRMISRWPLRAGVVVVDDVVYTLAGMWPTEGVYAYALKAETGEVLWRNDTTGMQYVELPHPGATGFSGVAPQGYLAVSGDVLLVPTGRSCPAAFNRHTGKFLYCWPHRSWDDAKRGGCWLTTGSGLYFNGVREFKGTSESLVDEASPLPDDGMVAYELATNKPVFDLRGKNRVLAAGDTLYAVGSGEAAAYDLAALRAGKPAAEALKWRAPHLRVYGLALAGNTLFIGGKGVLTALDAATGAKKWHRTQDIPGPIRGLAVGGGRLVAATDQGVLTCFTPAKVGARLVNDAPDWRIEMPATASAMADAILRKAGTQDGYALLVGDAAPSLSAALAMRSRLHIVHAVHGEERAAEAHQQLLRTDLYGTRVAVVDVAAWDRLPFAPYFADVVVVAGPTAGLSGQELYRVLRPCGGTLVFADDLAPEESGRLVAETGASEEEVLDAADGPAAVRGVLAGAGEWRHQWADGGRTGIGQEGRLHMPLELLWFGGPGPNRMMDRHFGTSPPLSVNGRVFVTGEHDLIAFDAYNGRELWCRPMRGLGRRGAMWNAANSVADDDMIYVAVGPACYRIRQDTGENVATFDIPEAVSAQPIDWGYIGVAGDLLLGTCGTSLGLFALDKHDGALRWHWRSARTVPLAAIAFGDGRAYCLDLEPPDEQARRRGELKKPVRSLVALSLTDGAEVWRRDDVPRTPSDQVQFAAGVVSVYANVAYDAATGDLLWQKAVAPERPPLIRGDWIIAQPHAYHLRTGEQRLGTDPATGDDAGWAYIQSYGCGGVAGCQSMLFFRSGVAGFYDFDTDGTTTFGGVRVGCSINIIAANGLAILPETSSGCPCTYNFQTTLALVPSEDRKPESWFVFAGRKSAEPAARLNLNIGAPGDRRDDDGTVWLGMPRPILGGAVPVAMSASSQSAQYYRHPREDELAGMPKPWLYGSGVRDPGRITVDLLSLKPSVALACDAPLTIDGALDQSLVDAGGNGRTRLGFSNGLKRSADVYLRYDDENLYVAIRCTQDQGGTPWVKATVGEDARVWEDDSWELYLSDKSRATCVHLGVSASGARFDGRWDYTAYEALRGLDRAWTGPWQSAAATDETSMTVEVAVPFRTLADAGIDRDTLALNVLGTGPGNLGSPDFLSVPTDGFAARWRGFIEPPAAGTYTFTLRADQRALLRIGDKTVVEHDGKGTPSETSADVTLEAGQRQPIEVFYEEGRGAATVQLFWGSPSIPKAIVPASVLYTSDGQAGGLSAAYSSRWYEEPILERVDKAIDFEWAEVDLRKVPKSELCYQWGARPQRSQAFLPVSYGPPKLEDTYTVRLHFAEVEDVQPGQRVFDVLVQDLPLLEGVDIAHETGGGKAPLVTELKGISVGDGTAINLDFVPRGGAPPVVNGIEIIAE